MQTGRQAVCGYHASRRHTTGLAARMRAGWIVLPALCLVGFMSPVEAVAQPGATTTSPTVILLSPRQLNPLARRARVAIQAQLGTTPVRVEVHWLRGPGNTTQRYRALARRLSGRPGVIAVVWFELAVQARAYVLLSRCGRVLERNLANVHARGRVESLAIIVGSSMRAVLRGGGGQCPPPVVVVPAPPPPAPPRASVLRRWSVGLSFAADFLYEGVSFASFTRLQPYVGGMAMGSVGARLQLGYLVAPRWRVGLSGHIGAVRSDYTEGPILSWSVLGRVAYYLTGPPRRWFSCYLGVEVGLGRVYGALSMGEENKRDSFEHGLGVLGALVGIRAGSRLVGWFLELIPGVVFPRQATFRLQLVTGLRVRI